MISEFFIENEIIYKEILKNYITESWLKEDISVKKWEILYKVYKSNLLMNIEVSGEMIQSWFCIVLLFTSIISFTFSIAGDSSVYKSGYWEVNYLLK